MTTFKTKHTNFTEYGIQCNWIDSNKSNSTKDPSADNEVICNYTYLLERMMRQICEWVYAHNAKTDNEYMYLELKDNRDISRIRSYYERKGIT